MPTDDQRCATCKHWTRDEWSEPGEGDCELGKTEDGKPLHPTLAWALDSEYYSGSLVTKAEYGCVQYAPKDGDEHE